MTKEQIKAVLDRVLSWPPEQQEDAAEMLLLLEAQEGETYVPTEDELAAIKDGAAQALRGECASEEEMAALWKRFGG